MTVPSIQAINLSKRYGSFVALSNLNLKISGSKCVGFLGPNGAGKTTTLKIFTDLIRPSDGEALINGLDVHKDKKKALASCGSLVETPEVYPSLTPREALSMVAEIKGIRHNEIASDIKRVVEEVRMGDWVNKAVGSFSKGMKQRINVAAALIGDPKVILLDEPTSGLDPRGMSEIREIIKNLKKKNRLIFMSSHLLSEVSEVCDEVAMIDHGKLLAYDRLNRVVSKFSGRGSNVIEATFVKPLGSAAINRIRRISGVSSVDRLDHSRFDIGITGGIRTQERLLAKLVSMKLGLLSFKSSSSALEDAYLSAFKETL